MKSLIVDDEPMPGKMLVELINKHCFEIEETHHETSPHEALERLKNEHFDIVFLDVEMPGMNAFELLDQIDLPRDTVVIFVTAYSNYAVDAFKANAAYYILKPVVKEELIKAVRKASAHLQKGSLNNKEARVGSISVYDGENYQIIHNEDIIRIEADGSYAKVICTDGRSLLSSKRLGHYEKQLDDKGFYRCHHSHLINLQHLLKVSKGKSPVLTLKNDQVVPLSPSKKQQLNRLVGL